MIGIGPALEALAAVFNWATGRSALNNQAPIVAAKLGQSNADVIAKTNDAIQSKDTNEIRKELAE